MTDLQEVTLENLCGGAVPELFARELAAVLQNVSDPNTKAKKARTITIKVRITPVSESRDGAFIEVAVDSDLSGVQPIGTAVHLVRRGGRTIAYGKNPNQTELPLTRDDLEIVNRTTGEVTNA